ncbi:chaplin [Streptomyces sp. NPDC050418]|uniref:chaplin n=1 Tax=Streptomyces sp. NPDC050418 TaxID=3365612 RepID=UPI0037BA975F
MQTYVRRGAISLAVAVSSLGFASAAVAADQPAPGTGQSAPDSGADTLAGPSVQDEAPQDAAPQDEAQQDTAAQETAPQDGAQESATGSHSEAETHGSPGLLSGNQVQAPVSVPVNACGNSVNVVGVGNAASGNSCASGVEETPAPVPSEPTPSSNPAVPPAPAPELPEEPANHPAPQLAETGSASTAALAGGGAALLLGGMVLYRRSRTDG